MSTSIPVQPKITQDGLAACLAADGAGLELQLTAIAFGTGLYEPTGAEHALVAEVIRVPIAGGGNITPTQLQIYAEVMAATGAPFWCGEVGFFAGTVLVAVVSRPDPAMMFISDEISTMATYSLGLAALPAANVTVLVDPSVSAAAHLIGVHETAVDPHPQYLTTVRAEETFALLGGLATQPFLVADATDPKDAVNLQTGDARYVLKVSGYQPGDIIDYSGPILGPGRLACPIAPTDLSRTAYPELFIGLTWRMAGTLTTGSNVIAGVAGDISHFFGGCPVSGPGIQSGSTVTSVNTTTGAVTISKPATAPGTITVVYAPWGVGDGVNTFGMPWFPIDYPALQSNGNLGTTTNGAVISHAHGVSITTGQENQAHNHNGSTDAPGDHAHTYGTLSPFTRTGEEAGSGSTGFMVASRDFDQYGTGAAGNHTHNVSTGSENQNHNHNVIGNTAATGGTPNMPAGVRVRKCVQYM